MRCIHCLAIMTIAASLITLHCAKARETVDKPLFGLNSAKPTAKKGEFVLCPSRQFYESAVEKGVDKTTFIYYAATMMEPGDQQSTLKNLAGRTFSLPNEMIISIPSGQKSKVGDILLTWWQNGSGMQRSIVVGGSATQPIVRYLDIKLDNPSDAGKKEEKLKPDSFCVLKNEWQIGTTVRAQDPKQPEVQLHGQLLAMDEDRVLIRNWTGKLSVHPRKLTQPLPIVPNLNPNDAVQVALFGSFKPATVRRVDKSIGRVFATYQFARKEKEAAFAFGDVYSE